MLIRDPDGAEQAIDLGHLSLLDLKPLGRVDVALGQFLVVLWVRKAYLRALTIARNV